MKTFLILLLISGTSLGTYFGYRHYYIETLKLSEIVGHTDDSLTNIAINFLDFDTGLTRNDITRLKNQKDFWIGRMKEVENIQDPDLKIQANTKLLSDMMEDPTMKKVCKIITSKGFGFAINIIERISS